MAQSHSPRPGRTKVRRQAGVVGAVLAAALFAPSVAAATTDSYTGVGKHSWIVPPGVTQLTIEVAGAGGGSDAGGNGCTPATGAVLEGTVTVPQGAQLTIDVGGRGGDAPVGGAGGAAGGGGDLDGGAGGSAGASGNGGPVGGGGGGGGTMISSTAGPIAVAGGGGGCGGFASPAGFGLGGAHGVPGGNGSQNAGGGGADTGATLPAGGPSDPTTETGGSAGSGAAGGAGAGASGLHYGGGGGGGGSAGGGGGGGAEPLHGIAGGGGGGSDLVPSGVTLASQASTGNGHVTITYASSWVGTVVGKVFIPQNYPPVRNGYTLLQTGVDPGSAWIVPSSGVITQWGFETHAQVPDALELKVARGPRDTIGAGHLAIVGSSPAGSLLPSQLNVYGVRIPVQAGDVLGAYQGGNANIASVPNDFFPDFAAAASGDPALGSTTFFDYEPNGIKVPVTALVEPDSDADGFGDTTQDACLGRFGTANGCPQADLSLTATANTPTVNAGQSVVYTLTATNNGPDPASVTITDPVPDGSTLSGAVSNPGSCDAGPPVKCDLGTLASGQSGTVTAIVEATKTGTLTNTATVAAPAVPAGVGAGDPNAANDAATVSTDVLAPGGGTPGGGTPGGGTPGGGVPGTVVFKGVTIKLSHGRINTTKGIARVTLVSTLAAKGQVKLTTVAGKGKKRRTIGLGSAAFSIGAGKTKVVAVHLNRSARTLLRQRGGALQVLASVPAIGPAGAKKTTSAHATLKS